MAGLTFIDVDHGSKAAAMKLHHDCFGGMRLRAAGDNQVFTLQQSGRALARSWAIAAISAWRERHDELDGRVVRNGSTRVAATLFKALEQDVHNGDMNTANAHRGGDYVYGTFT
ncbi:MAG: hypothetical protein AAGG72_01105 [Pseudomonadota bacterium]